MQKKISLLLSFVVVVSILFLIVVIAITGLLGALWIPLAMALFLLFLPVFAVTQGKSMFEGLFDIDLSPKHRLPIRLFVVTLAAFAVAGTADAAARLMLLEGPERFQVFNLHLWPIVEEWISSKQSGESVFVQGAVLAFFAAWVAGFAIAVSRYQDSSRSLWRMVTGAGSAIVLADACALWLMSGKNGIACAIASRTSSVPAIFRLGPGYADAAWIHQIELILSFLAASLFYLVLGWYGRRELGTHRTIPAIIAPLMAVLILGEIGSAWEFFLGRWHIPLLLVIAIGAAIDSRIRSADHTYSMVERKDPPAPEPAHVLTVKPRECAILVASAGGGIQAAAWTAQVLEGLRKLHGDAFDHALCMISSISGGSMGSACYVNWLHNEDRVPCPVQAASASSLDEVAWGLAWPDLWRLLLPWPFGRMIDRGRAMEIAWQGNATCQDKPVELDEALSEWNQSVANGELPALIMNSTMVEVGGPLLLGTSDVNGDPKRKLSSGWEDGDQLHRIGERRMDIPVVRAARLSATFPYVTPVARPDKANHQPHMCDGGLYDNYGMATLTEWLDQALEATQQVRRILVVQINGFPSDNPEIPRRTGGGWLDQLLAPLSALVNVRTVGQVSHRDIEFKMLQAKWCLRDVEIEDAVFDFDPPSHGAPAPTPPLSWHLMPRQIKAISDMWKSDAEKLNEAKQKVANFLAGIQK